MVANSPGLIAGSNVLHRLLMPRHPPCALHSLSQQRQNNTTPSNTNIQKKHTSPPPNQRDRPAHTTSHPMRIPGMTPIKHFHNHTPRPHQRRIGCDTVAKMLASTMQISNNNPTNTHHHHPETSRATSSSRQREDQKTQTRPTPPTRGRRRRSLILQDPTVCLTPSPTNVRQRVTNNPQPNSQERDRRRFH